MPGLLTTHVLDTGHGHPAAGMWLEHFRIEDGKRNLLKTVRTDEDGRTDEPLLTEAEFGRGGYEIVFSVGGVFQGRRRTSLPGSGTDPVRISDPDSHYHVPLLASPWSYSTYRGS